MAFPNSSNLSTDDAETAGTSKMNSSQEIDMSHTKKGKFSISSIIIKNFNLLYIFLDLGFDIESMTESSSLIISEEFPISSSSNNNAGTCEKSGSTSQAVLLDDSNISDIKTGRFILPRFY